MASVPVKRAAAQDRGQQGHLNGDGEGLERGTAWRYASRPMTDFPAPYQPEGWRNGEPPPHLARALQAAAIARARAAQVRAGGRTTNSNADASLEQRLKPERGSAPTEPQPKARLLAKRFARTAEAAAHVRQSAFSDGRPDPWAFSLRDRADNRSLPRRWLARLFGRPLVPGEPAARVPDGSSDAGRPKYLPPPESNRAAEVETTPLNGRDARSHAAASKEERPAIDRPLPGGFRPSPAPSGGVARSGMPRFRRGSSHWEERSRELSSGMGSRSPSRALRVARTPALVEFRAAAARSAVALVRDWCLTWSGRGAPARYDWMAADRAGASLPRLPAPRIAAAEMRSPAAKPLAESPASAIGQWLVADPASIARTGCSQARAHAAARRLRSAKLFLAISVGIFGGFALGIAAGGSAIVTGFNLGQIGELNGMMFQSSADRQAPDGTSNSTTDRAAPSRSAEAPRPPAELGTVPSGPEKSGPARITSPAVSAGASGPQAKAGEAPSPGTPRPASAMEQRGRATNVATVRRASAPSDHVQVVPDRPVALQAAVTSWDAAYARGHQAQVEGDLAAATHWYGQAAKLNPDHPAILYDLAYVLQIQGHAEAAINRYRRVIELNPDHPHAYYNLGFLLHKKGDNDSAVAHYEKAALMSPQNPYVYYNMALIREDSDDLTGAQALYEKVIALGPDRRPGLDARRRLSALKAGDSGIARNR